MLNYGKGILAGAYFAAMRAGSFTVACVLATRSLLAQGVLINEVMPGADDGPDWVELYGTGGRALDLFGHILVCDGRSARVQEHLLLPAHQVVRLICTLHRDSTGHALKLHLPRKGGSLLLVAPDGATMLDIYSWPALPRGISIGRVEDGGRQWAYFAEPTPGNSDRGSPHVSRLLAAPRLTCTGGTLTFTAAEGSTVRYTTDGSIPRESSPELPPAPAIAAPAIITARAFAPDALPSPTATFTLPNGDHTTAWWALRVGPEDLFAGAHGLLAHGASANFSRTGKAWQRTADLELHTPDSTTARNVRLSIAGSGTRGLPKKNFKLRTAGDQAVPLPGGAAWTELTLRADATPHAFLRGLFMERIARASHVDVQPSTPVTLYINGRDQGLYRVMPAKNAAWVRSMSGAESVDVIAGPAGEVVSGDDHHWRKALDLLLHGAGPDSLSRWIDVASLIDLACFDLWTGRADHDLNVRCWRPKTNDGRFRWILFDEDLWTAPEEGTVERMCSASAPEAPYLPQLLQQEDLRDRLLARMSVWLATDLAPDRALALADSVAAPWQAALEHDRAIWKDSMATVDPAEGLADLRHHITARPAALERQLSHRTGRALRSISVRVEPARAGEVIVEGSPLTDDERSLVAFSGVPLHFRAVPAAGYEFAGWQGAGTAADRTIDPARERSAKAMFRPIGTSSRHGLQQRGE